MNNTPWSDQENDVLRKIAEHGGTIEDAVLILAGRTKTAINCHVSVLGLSLAGEPKEINQDAFKRFLKERRK